MRLDLTEIFHVLSLMVNMEGVVFKPTSDVLQINRCSSVRPSVRLLPAFSGLAHQFFSDLLHNDEKWQYSNCDGTRFQKKICWANWAKICLKIGFFRLFWTEQNCIIIFSDFWQKDRGQGCLIFHGKFLFAVKYGIFVFGEIPFYPCFYHFPVTSFSFLSTPIQAAHCIFLLSDNFSIFI